MLTTGIERTPESVEGETSSAETLLRTAMEELKQMREERALQIRQQEDLVTLLRQREMELRHLQENQLSLSCNSAANKTRDARDQNILPLERETVITGEEETSRILLNNESGLKLKPDTFDGSTPLREFFSQFNLIARASRWNEETKTAVLVSCLRGKARAVLENVQDLDNFKFAELKSKLELRFGEIHSLQSYYCQFTNRKQKFGENFAAFGAEIERLSQFAYPECPHSVRDKIACAQFVSAISDGFIRRTLQLEGISSLKVAIERAKTVKSIQESYFEQKKRSNFNFYKRKENYFSLRKGESDVEKEEKQGKDGNKSKFIKQNGNGKRYENKNRMECWLCGKEGHLRFECPGKLGNGV